jgi:hypothetical protein
MRKELKKVLSFGVLIFGLVFLSGCGSTEQKNQAPQTGGKTPTEKVPVAGEKTPSASSSTGTNLNGNSATTSATNEEDLLLSQEENDAKDAVPSDQETADLTSSYDNE